MRNRLAELIAEEGITSSKFAELLEVQPSNISHILSGRNNPSYDFIVRVLSKFTNVNPDWLLLGEGDIYRSKIEGVDSETIDNELDLFNNIDDFTDVKEQDNTINRENIEANPVELPTNIAPVVTNVEHAATPTKQIERVIIFYSDKSFTEYSPS